MAFEKSPKKEASGLLKTGSLDDRMIAGQEDRKQATEWCKPGPGVTERDTL